MEKFDFFLCVEYILLKKNWFTYSMYQVHSTHFWSNKKTRNFRSLGNPATIFGTNHFIVYCVE